MALRALIYIEPVSYRDNPLLLMTWVDWICAMIVASQGPARSIDFALIANSSICAQFASRIDAGMGVAFPITQYEAIGAFAFDRGDYSRDLYDTDRLHRVDNAPLLRRLAQIREEFSPDLVLSFSENRYLHAAFPASRLLFLELAPLPRLCSRYYLFTDPCGHQSGSLLAAAAGSKPVDSDPGSPLAAIFSDLFTSRLRVHPLHDSVAQWLDAIAPDRKIALIALQPEDWITYDGAYETLPMESVLMRCLQALPEDWLGIPTYHPIKRLSVATEELLAMEFANVRFPPANIASGLTEMYLPRANAVITVSSTCALTASVLGRRVVSLGSSPCSGAGKTISDLASSDDCPAQNSEHILRLLCSPYCHDIEDVMHRSGYFSQFLVEFHEAVDPIAFFTDAAGDRETRLRAILAAA